MCGVGGCIIRRGYGQLWDAGRALAGDGRAFYSGWWAEPRERDEPERGRADEGDRRPVRDVVAYVEQGGSGRAAVYGSKSVHGGRRIYDSLQCDYHWAYLDFSPKGRCVLSRDIAQYRGDLPYCFHHTYC